MFWFWLWHFFSYKTIIFGTWRDDKITGTDADERIIGWWGNDEIDAGGGDDVVKGGYGRDFLQGGAGSDLIFGGSGRDHVLHDVDLNRNNPDYADGGWGYDTLELQFRESTLTELGISETDIQNFFNQQNGGFWSSVNFSSLGFNLSVRSFEALQITVINEDPDAVDDDAFTDEASLLSINAPGVLINDTDPGLDPLIVSAVNGNAADVGTLITLNSGALLTVNADGSYQYNPNGQFEVGGF